LDAELNLPNLNTGLVTDTQQSNIASIRTSSTPFDQQITPSVGGLVLPTSETGEIGGFDLPGGESARLRPSILLERDEGTALGLDLFDFDADGNFHEYQYGTEASHDGLNVSNDDTVNARNGPKHAEGQQASTVFAVSVSYPMMQYS
jgi:hypothetical protein